MTGLEPRLNALLRRAGVRELPAPALRGALVLSAGLVCVAAWRWWPSSDPASVVEIGQTASAPSPTSVSREPTPPVLVHVVGAVRRPGVYQLDGGGRVFDAIEKAGGVLPDAACAAVNMAREVRDGEQIMVPDTDAVQNQAPAGAGGAAAPVDINSADVAALDQLPGIGPSTAQKIVSDREANGPFESTEALSRVPGIGEKKLEQLKGLIRVP